VGKQNASKHTPKEPWDIAENRGKVLVPAVYIVPTASHQNGVLKCEREGNLHNRSPFLVFPIYMSQISKHFLWEHLLARSLDAELFSPAKGGSEHLPCIADIEVPAEFR
jgi:hypothetical protein